MRSEDWIRLGGIIGLSFIYLLVFFTLGLFTSTVTRRPATSLIFALSIWAVMALSVPRIGCSIAKGTRPVQPNFTFGLEKRAVRQGSFEEFREQLWKMDDEYISTVDGQIKMGQNLSHEVQFRVVTFELFHNFKHLALQHRNTNSDRLFQNWFFYKPNNL